MNNIANESPSKKLPSEKNRSPYKWRDGHNGIHMDIGPYLVCVRWDWPGDKTDSCAMIQVCRADGEAVGESKGSVPGVHYQALQPEEKHQKERRSQECKCCQFSSPA